MPELYRPKVYAHRGSNTLAPENSRPAFDLALMEGADGFETDIQLSKDKVPLLFHDDELERIGMPGKTIDQFSWDSLELLDISLLSSEFHRFCGLMSLSEFLKTYYSRTPLLLEIKKFSETSAEEAEENIRQIINQLLIASIKSDSVMISSFEFPLLKIVNDLSDNNFIVANIEEKDEAENLKALMKDLPFIKGVCFKNTLVNDKVINEAKNLGLCSLTYTCNTYEEIESAVSSRIDIIISDIPGECRKTVNKILKG